MSVVLRRSSIALIMSDLEVTSIYRIFFYKFYFTLALKKKEKKKDITNTCKRMHSFSMEENL